MPQILITRKRLSAIELSNNSKNLQQAVAADDIDIASNDGHKYPHQRDAWGQMLVAWPVVAFAASNAFAAAAAAAAAAAVAAAAAAAVTGLSATVA